MSELSSDITVVGGGVAGLWTAKELLERGHSVNVVEKSENLASGATTRNEGWLHAGTYHAVAIYDELDAERVTSRTVYGHDAIVDFVPESIEHSTTYAFINTDELAETALRRWGRFNIQNREMPVRRFEDEGFDIKRIGAAFEVKDKSVNSRVICSKLAQFVLENGGRIFTEAEFLPTGETTADMMIGDERHSLRSDAFVIAAGTGTKRIFEGMTGERFPMRYFKSHLLITPRITEDNYFYMDPLEAGIMSHGDASIIGVNREAMEVRDPNYDVIPVAEQVVYGALGNMLPRARQFALGSAAILSVACAKADVSEGFTQANADPTVVLQDLNIKVFEPASNYICAIPGKMTEAPALARAAADYIEGRGSGLKPQGESIRSTVIGGGSVPPVKSRPADDWVREQALQENVR